MIGSCPSGDAAVIMQKSYAVTKAPAESDGNVGPVIAAGNYYWIGIICHNPQNGGKALFQYSRATGSATQAITAPDLSTNYSPSLDNAVAADIHAMRVVAAGTRLVYSGPPNSSSGTVWVANINPMGNTVDMDKIVKAVIFSKKCRSFSAFDCATKAKHIYAEKMSEVDARSYVDPTTTTSPVPEDWGFQGPVPWKWTVIVAGGLEAAPTLGTSPALFSLENFRISHVKANPSQETGGFGASLLHNVATQVEGPVEGMATQLAAKAGQQAAGEMETVWNSLTGAAAVRLQQAIPGLMA